MKEGFKFCETVNEMFKNSPQTISKGRKIADILQFRKKEQKEYIYITSTQGKELSLNYNLLHLTLFQQENKF